MTGSLSLLLALVLLFAWATVLLGRQLRRPHGWFGRRVMAALLNEGNRELLEAALAAAAARPGERALDIGFGGGLTLERLAAVVGSSGVAGVEISEEMIAALQARTGGAFDLRLADAAALPFPDASFDVVLSVNTIYFWSDPRAVLAEAKRVLRPAGRFVLGYRTGFFVRATPVTWYGFRFYSDREVRELFAAVGLEAEIRRGAAGDRLAVADRR